MAQRFKTSRRSPRSNRRSDPGDDLGSNPIWSAARRTEFHRQDREQAGSKGDQHVRPQSGSAMTVFTLQADRGSQRGGERISSAPHGKNFANPRGRGHGARRLSPFQQHPQSASVAGPLLRRLLRGETHMACLAVNASPFNCRWIERGSEMRVSNWTYALCARPLSQSRPVSEEECARCPWWDSRDDDSSPRAAPNPA
jgi:hypothetical protein